jgi:hypothetical protein
MDIDADFMATNMSTLVCGNMDKNTDEFNACDKNSISGPDNVAYVLGHDGLVIGACFSAVLSRQLRNFSGSMPPSIMSRSVEDGQGHFTHYWPSQSC